MTLPLRYRDVLRQHPVESERIIAELARKGVSFAPGRFRWVLHYSVQLAAFGVAPHIASCALTATARRHRVSRTLGVVPLYVHLL